MQIMTSQEVKLAPPSPPSLQQLSQFDLSDHTEALDRATKIYYFALGLLLTSIGCCIACCSFRNVNFWIQLPCFLSLPFTIIIFCFALNEMKPFAFTQANVSFAQWSQ